MSGGPGVLARHKHEAYGLLTFIALAAIAVLVAAVYLQAFTPFVTTTLRTDRTGLLLDVDSDVTMRNVNIGKVGAVRVDGPDGAVVDVLIQPDQADFVPANVTGQIISPTLFGPKFVDLLPPERPTERRIASGDEIVAAAVQVEVNEVFDNLIDLLQSIEPAKLNTALGALSTSLQGRGHQLGEYLTSLNAYLEQLNPSLPALSNDLALAPEVIETFADVSPEFLRVVDNLTTTSHTVVEQAPAIDAVIVGFTGFSGTAQSFLEQNEDGLIETLDVLRPTTALLERYSPMFPCLFESANTLRKITEPAFGGTVPGLRTVTSFGPGQEPYRFPENLPQLGVDAPGCYDGIPPAGTFPRHTFFPDGSPRLDVRGNPPTLGDTPLATTLFGDLAPLIPAPLAPVTAPLAPGMPGGLPGGGPR